MQYMGINENRFRFLGIAMVLVAVTVVFLVEQVIQPSYWIKSAVKVLAFSAPVVLYSFLRGISLTETINLRKITGPAPIVFCMLLFSVGVVALFFIFRDNLDLDGIRQNLMRKENLSPENCLYVFAYIILCNSFLEEAFFRGFVYGLFRSKVAGALISAVLFSLYHIGIFITWFSLPIFILCVAGLTLVGLFLQWISEKYHSIAASYVVHASANLSINLIGALLILEIIGK